MSSAELLFTTSEEPEDTENGWTLTDVWILYYWFLLVIILLIMLFQFVASLYQGDRLKSRNRVSLSYSSSKDKFKISAASLLLISLYVAYVGNFIGVLITLARLDALKPLGWKVTKKFCRYTYAVNFCATATVKIANYVFFTYRAKLAQGLNIILSDIWFDVIIPATLAVLWVGEIVFVALNPLRGDKRTSPTTGRDLCYWQPRDLNFAHYISFGLLVLIDTSSAVFFLYLFGKPLQSILKTQRSKSSRSINITDKRKNFKLKTTIRINFACSILTTASSVFVAWTFWNVGDWIAIGDYGWNSLCCFLMLASNRRLLVHAFCCFKKKKSHRRTKPNSPLSSKQDVEMTNISTDTGTDQPNVSGNSSANSSVTRHQQAPSFSNVTYSNHGTHQSELQLQTQSKCCDSKISSKTIQFYRWFGYIFCPPKCFMVICCCRSTNFGINKSNDKRSIIGKLFDPPTSSNHSVNSKSRDMSNRLNSIDE